MVATSPRSTTPNPAGVRARRAGPLGGPASADAPSVGLPLRFVLSGLLALLIGLVWLTLRPDLLATYHYNQYAVAVTHLFTLGFIATIIMGAMYQLVPVALETRLYSERLARWQFVVHVVGVAGMVWMFWVWNLKNVGHFGSLLAFGVGLFVYNLARTLWRIPRWDVVAGGIVSALVWLSLAVLAGLTVAAAKCTYENVPQLSPGNPFGPLLHLLRQAPGWVGRFNPVAVMHAHAHLGAVGFFLMMIVAVSYKLVPMFTLSELRSRRRAWWSVGLLNGGLVGLFVTMAIGSAWKLAWALVIVGGLGLYGVELGAIVRARRRRVLDWGVRYFLTAVGLLAPLSVLGIVLCWPGLPATLLTTQLETVYGFLALIGVVAFAILGFLYKIVPFLVWYHRYSRLVGRARVPNLADLYSPRLQAASYWLLVGGLLTASVSSALAHARGVQVGCGLLLAAFLVFAVNLGQILSHFFGPGAVAPPAATKAT